MIRILWFTNTPSLYRQNSNAYNGGGWIEALEEYLQRKHDIELAVSFFHSDSVFKIKKENVTYYPICVKRNIVKKIWDKINRQRRQDKDIKSFLQVVDDFKPDIIHIFGSENSFGLLAQYTSVPVVLHLQGIISAYAYAYYPPSYSNWEMVILLRFNLIRLFFHFKEYHEFCQYAAQREKQIFTYVKNFMGRTIWDKNIVSILSPDAKYYYCGEMLRKSFYGSKYKNNYNGKERLILVSVISQPLYKGFDLIVKTAGILSNIISFEWQVFGNINVAVTERKFKIKCSSVNIVVKGVISADILTDMLINADIFVHPSYIDNSPNSVCEAQMLGVPVISTNVGGISSLIDNMVNGFLVPANDPFTMAASVLLLYNNKTLSENIGKKGRETAIQRHDREKITNDLLYIYHDILSERVDT